MSPASTRATPLSRQEIVDAALRTTARTGLDELTMRAVARELGVSPMAIYYHVADKDELVGLVIAQVSARHAPLRLESDGWEAALRRYLLSLWEEQARYPGVGAHLIGQPILGTTPETIASGVQFFEDAGFPTRAARLAWSFALTYVHGRLSVDTRLRGTRSDGIRAEGLHAHDYVEFGVDAVVAGLRGMLDNEGAP